MALPTLTGTARLTADPELKFTGNGIAVAKINLAFNSRRKNQQTGEWEDADTFFVGGTLFGDRAETAAEHLRKGTEVEVRGRLKTRQWEQDGQRRSMPELLVDAIAPTLRSATKKADRSGTPAAPSSGDPWATTTGGGGGFSSDPPF